MKTLLKILKYLFFAIIALLVLGFIGIKIASEKVPVGSDAAQADQLAESMFTALDKPGWDTTQYVTWNFAGRNQYVWNKAENLVEVTMGTSRYLLDTKSVTGIAFENGQVVEGDAAEAMKEKAWSNWCNDSFWLMAPFKAKDPGTERHLVDVEGGKGLLVSYKSGGVTPGDKYLWILDENNIPTSYKMWVKIIPIGGMSASWEGWKDFYSGARLSTSHKLGPITLELSEMNCGQTLTSIGKSESLFAEMN